MALNSRVNPRTTQPPTLASSKDKNLAPWQALSGRINMRLIINLNRHQLIVARIRINQHSTPHPDFMQDRLYKLDVEDWLFWCPNLSGWANGANLDSRSKVKLLVGPRLSMCQSISLNGNHNGARDLGIWLLGRFRAVALSRRSKVLRMLRFIARGSAFNAFSISCYMY